MQIWRRYCCALGSYRSVDDTLSPDSALDSEWPLMLATKFAGQIGNRWLKGMTMARAAFA